MPPPEISKDRARRKCHSRPCYHPSLAFRGANRCLRQKGQQITSIAFVLTSCVVGNIESGARCKNLVRTWACAAHALSFALLGQGSKSTVANKPPPILFARLRIASSSCLSGVGFVLLSPTAGAITFSELFKGVALASLAMGSVYMLSALTISDQRRPDEGLHVFGCIRTPTCQSCCCARPSACHRA